MEGNLYAVGEFSTLFEPVSSIYKLQAGMCLQLTHFSRIEFPNIISWTVHFRFKGCLVVFFFIFNQILKETSVSNQWRT